MSDQPEANEDITEIEEAAGQPEKVIAFQDIVTPAVADAPAAPLPRVFKTGATRIVEDASMKDMTVAQVQQTLKASYPEIANATIRESVNADGQKVFEFLPVAGRKG